MGDAERPPGALRPSAVFAWCFAGLVFIGVILVLAHKLSVGASLVRVLAGMVLLTIGFWPLLRMRAFRAQFRLRDHPRG